MQYHREPNHALVEGHSLLPRPSCVVFLHIPKTAGTTLYAILDRQYAAKKILTIRDPSVPITPFAERAKRGELLLVRGHVPFGVHRQLGIRSRYITILRQPVERVMSIYGYIKRDKSHPLHSTLRDEGMTVSDFMNSEIAEQDAINGQTRQLAGTEGIDSHENMLELAKRNLATFSAVGLTERFDESLILFRRRLRWKLPLYRSKNVAPDTIRQEEQPVEVRARVEKGNHLDLELYDFAMKLFDRQIASEGPSFRAELNAFKGLNRLARFYKDLTG